MPISRIALSSAANAVTTAAGHLQVQRVSDSWQLCLMLQCMHLQVSIVDVTSKTKMFCVVGPESSAMLEGLGAAAPEPGHVALMAFQGSPVVVAEGSSLAAPGYTLVVDEQAAGEVWSNLTLKVVTPLLVAAIVQISCASCNQHNWQHRGWERTRCRSTVV